MRAKRSSSDESKKSTLIMTILILMPLLAFFLSLCIGRYHIEAGRTAGILFSAIAHIEQAGLELEQSIVLDIRLPRALLAMMVGAGLAVSGAAFQGLFGNPLVSPHILGVSSGAGFGAAMGILLSGHLAVVQLLALLFGILAVMATFMISRLKGSTQLFMLVLAGVIVGAFFQALISLIKYVADPQDKLPTIVYWLMGSLTGASFHDLLIAIPLIGAGIIIIFLLRWRINILSLDEDEARSMGINVQLTRWIVIAAATIITATSVSLCGIIGWVGLVIPHIGRMLVETDHRKLIPACISIGAFYLLLIDDIARTATAAEIPLSILTAVIGAPFFAYLLRKTGGKWS
ncbi:FecCD family ABC transporter permease [Syntrophomonas wolfei]|nr:iron ABC transporter permease [Syntrophomonas wolfei]